MADGDEHQANGSRAHRARLWGIFGLAGLGGLALGLALTFSVERLTSRGRVVRGVVLEGRSLEGANELGLLRSLTARSVELNAQPIELSLEAKKFSATPTELGVTVDPVATTKALLAQGRSGGFAHELGFWLARLFQAQEYEFSRRFEAKTFAVKVALFQNEGLPHPAEPRVFFEKELRAVYPEPLLMIDETGLRNLLEQRLAHAERGTVAIPVRRTEPALPRAEVDAGLEVARHLLENSILLVTADGRDQAQFSTKTLREALRSRVETTPRPHLVIDLAIEELAPSLRKARARLERPARSATFAVDPAGTITVVPSETGQRIDEAALLSELVRASASPERRGLLPLRTELPGGLANEEAIALSPGIKGLVAEFATRHPCCEARVENIHAVAALLDGYVLRPGETFSLNQFLGPRTKEGGYVEAPTIVRGKMKATAGGGISQFATTLFNAVFNGGYEIIQRQPHSYWFPRYPEGLEATVSYPSPDLIFKNDTRAGLLIKTRYDATSIRILLYGDNEGRRVERKVSRRSNIVSPPLEYAPNRALKADETKLVTRGQTGWTVMTARLIHYPNGTESEQGREVTYQPKPHVVEVHPCRIPKSMKGYTGEECPDEEDEPETVDEARAESETPNADESD